MRERIGEIIQEMHDLLIAANDTGDWSGINARLAEIDPATLSSVEVLTWLRSSAPASSEPEWKALRDRSLEAVRGRPDVPNIERTFRGLMPKDDDDRSALEAFQMLIPLFK